MVLKLSVSQLSKSIKQQYVVLFMTEIDMYKYLINTAYAKS